LDGTVTRADVLYESLAALLRSRPWQILLLPFWILRGKAYLKRKLASQVSLDVASLPYQSDFLGWLKDQKAHSGRELVLVTAADRIFADQIANHLGLFDRVLASDGNVNLKGQAKLKAIRSEVSGPFDYAGNEDADMVIWCQAQNAIVVG